MRLFFQQFKDHNNWAWSRILDRFFITFNELGSDDYAKCEFYRSVSIMTVLASNADRANINDIK